MSADLRECPMCGSTEVGQDGELDSIVCVNHGPGKTGELLMPGRSPSETLRLDMGYLESPQQLRDAWNAPRHYDAALSEAHRERDRFKTLFEMCAPGLTETQRLLEVARTERDNETAALAEAREEIERLTRAMKNIRLAAASGAVFGHGATPQSDFRMALRKDDALKHVIRFCADVGIEASITRDGATR